MRRQKSQSSRHVSRDANPFGSGEKSPFEQNTNRRVSRSSRTLGHGYEDPDPSNATPPDANPFGNDTQATPSDKGRADSSNDITPNAMFTPSPGPSDMTKSASLKSLESQHSAASSSSHPNLSRADSVLSETQQFMRDMGVEWQDDGDAKTCKVCASKFTTFLRRHHCRLCGGIVCGGCSGQQLPLPGFEGKGKQRTCDDCVNHLIERMISSKVAVKAAKEVLRSANERTAEVLSELDEAQESVKRKAKELQRKTEELAAVSAKLAQALDSLRAKTEVNDDLHAQLDQKNDQISQKNHQISQKNHRISELQRALVALETRKSSEKKHKRSKSRTIDSYLEPPAPPNPFESAPPNPFESAEPDSMGGCREGAPTMGADVVRHQPQLSSDPSKRTHGDLTEPLLDPVAMTPPHDTDERTDEQQKEAGCCCVCM